MDELDLTDSPVVKSLQTPPASEGMTGISPVRISPLSGNDSNSPVFGEYTPLARLPRKVNVPKMVIDVEDYNDKERTEEDDCKIYVKNIRTKKKSLSMPELSRFLQRYGEVADIRLRNSGFQYACVQFKEATTAQLVLADRPITMDDNHRLFVEERMRSDPDLSVASNQQLFLPDLAPDLRERDILPAFRQYGHVLDLNIREGPNGVYGTLVYATQHEASLVARYRNVFTTEGRDIVVRPHRSKPSTGRHR